MKILVNMKLGFHTVADHLEPLTRSQVVSSILVARYQLGPSIPKVQYYCPPHFIAKIPILATIYRLLLLLYLSLLHKPDIIHSYMLFPHGIMGFIIAKVTRRPVGISLLAGPIELYSIGSPLGVDYNKTVPWMGRIALRILRNCTYVTVTDTYTKNFLQSYGLKESRIYILPHVSGRINCYPRDLPKRYDAVTIGRLAPVKHVETLIMATKKVKERGLENIKVGIVGDGPSRKGLEKLSESLTLTDNIEFLGFRDDVENYYNSAKCYVLTSEREGAPIALLEAMACGIPPIVSRCGNVSDILQNGYNAIIIEDCADIEGFADAIAEVLRNDEFRSRLAGNALTTSQEKSPDKITLIWESIIRKVEYENQRKGLPEK